MDYSKNPQRSKISRASIKAQCLEKVKSIFRTYSPNMGQAEIEKQAKQLVKGWDKDCADAKSPEEYGAKMKQLFTMFEQKLNPNSSQQQTPADQYAMVQEMKEALPQIKNFKETTEFIGQNDLRLLEQLINFIEKIDLSHHSMESLSNPKNTIKLYYDRLFIPIHKTILKKLNQENSQNNKMQQSNSASSMNQSPAVDHSAMAARLSPQPHPQQQQQFMQQPNQPMQQTQGPPLHPLNQVPQHQPPKPSGPPLQAINQQQQMKQRGARAPTQTSPIPPQQVMQPPMQQQQMHPPNPPQMQQMRPQAPQPQQAQPDTPLEPKKQIQMLFSQVRSECAVFYATPHPPHF